MLRLAALGLAHEANTFSSQPVDMAVVTASGVLLGDEIVFQHAGGSSTMSGYLAAGQQPGVELVPLVSTTLVPAGRFTRGALETCASQMLALLGKHGPFDGVLVDLHGAAVAEHIADVDGELLRRIRGLVGRDVPIGVSLDLHANISAQMCRHADVLNTYRTNPHMDAREVAEEVADLVIRAARGEIRPTIGFESIPAVVNILCQNTDALPMSEIFEDLRAVMTSPGVLSATVAEGYQYADVPEMGMSVVVVTDDDPNGAAAHAQALARRVWDRRTAFTATAPQADEAINLAAQVSQGPVLLLDVGDNIGGGSPGDSVVLLNAARGAGFTSLLTIIADPVAALACHVAGAGAVVALSIGGKSDAQTGPPVDATATVLALHGGVYSVSGPAHAGMRHFNAGPTAAVRLDSGQTVILTSKASPPLSPEQLNTVGLQPTQFQAIVAKGVHSPQAGYGPYVAEMLLVDTPGITGADLSRFAYQQRRRPLYPFEVDAVYPTDSTAAGRLESRSGWTR